jgi:hypothetical protein
MDLLETAHIACPYCGEHIEIMVDSSQSSQEYVEDCQVCCSPINIMASFDMDNKLHIEVARENE